MKEKEIEHQILSHLNSLEHCFAFKVDTTGIFDPTKKVFRVNHHPYKLRGTSDILGIYKGRPLAIEVKSPKGRLTEHQKVFIKAFSSHGGIAFKASSVNEVKAALEGF